MSKTLEIKFTEYGVAVSERMISEYPSDITHYEDRTHYDSEFVKLYLKLRDTE